MPKEHLFKPGERPTGRAKGTPNKTTVTAKAAIQSVYDRLQEQHPDPHGHFAEWARQNPTDFYAKIYPRLLPTEVVGKDGESLVQPQDDASAAARIAAILAQAQSIRDGGGDK